MLSIDLGLVGTILGIITTLICGAVWVMSLVNKLSSRAMAQEKDIQTLRRDVETMNQAIKEHESKNSYFRHNFDPVTKSLFDKMDDLEKTIKESIGDGFKHIKELFDTKIQNVEGKINEKK